MHDCHVVLPSPVRNISNAIQLFRSALMSFAEFLRDSPSWWSRLFIFSFSALSNSFLSRDQLGKPAPRLGPEPIQNTTPLVRSAMMPRSASYDIWDLSKVIVCVLWLYADLCATRTSPDTSFGSSTSRKIAARAWDSLGISCRQNAPKRRLSRLRQTRLGVGRTELQDPVEQLRTVPCQPTLCELSMCLFRSTSSHLCSPRTPNSIHGRNAT